MLVRWCRTDDWRLFWLDSEKTGHRRLWKVSFFCPLSLVGRSLIHSVSFLWVWSFRVGDSHSKRGSHPQGPRKTYRMVEPCQVTSQWSPATSSPHCSATLKKIFQRFFFAFTLLISGTAHVTEDYTMGATCETCACSVYLEATGGRGFASNSLRGAIAL